MAEERGHRQVLQLLQQFRAVQEARAQTYSHFQDGFLAFLRSGNGVQYRQVPSQYQVPHALSM